MKNLLIFCIALFFSTSLHAADVVTSGSATVDGKIDDWDLDPNGPHFFTEMYNGFAKNGKEQNLTNLYLKYGDDGTLYVLVHTTNNTADVIVDGDQAYVKIGSEGTKKKDQDKILDGNSTDPNVFDWVGITDDEKNAFGYEGKIPKFYDQFPLGIITLSINVHVQVEGSTLDEGASLTSGLIDKSINLSIPETHTPGSNIPIDGGLSILAIAGIGFGVYRNRKK